MSYPESTARRSGDSLKLSAGLAVGRIIGVRIIRSVYLTFKRVESNLSSGTSKALKVQHVAFPGHQLYVAGVVRKERGPRRLQASKGGYS